MAHKYPSSGGGAKNTLLSALAAAYANPEIADAKAPANPDAGDPSIGGAGGAAGSANMVRPTFPFYKQPSFWQNFLSGGQAGQNAWSGNDASMRSQAQGAQQLSNEQILGEARQRNLIDAQTHADLLAREATKQKAGIDQNATSQGYYNRIGEQAGIPIDQNQFQGQDVTQPLSLPSELSLLHREMQTPVAQEGVFGASMARNAAPGFANEATQAGTAVNLANAQNATQELPGIIASRNAAIQAQQGQEQRAQQTFEAKRPFLGVEPLPEGRAYLGLTPQMQRDAKFVNAPFVSEPSTTILPGGGVINMPTKVRTPGSITSVNELPPSPGEVINSPPRPGALAKPGIKDVAPPELGASLKTPNKVLVDSQGRKWLNGKQVNY